MDIVLLLICLLLTVIFIVSGLVMPVDHLGSRQAMLDFGVLIRLATPSAVLTGLVMAVSLILGILAW